MYSDGYDNVDNHLFKQILLTQMFLPALASQPQWEASNQGQSIESKILIYLASQSPWLKELP